MLDLQPLQLAQLLNFCHCAMAGGFPFVRKHGGVDAIFIYGRAQGEWEPQGVKGTSLLEVAADLYRQTGAAVVIPGYFGCTKDQGDTGYPGPDVWRKHLASFGVPSNQILCTAGEGANTKAEMDDCLALARRHSWRCLIALTQQSHALRAMLGTAQSLFRLQMHEDMKVFPMWPTVFDQRERVYGSQGQGPFSRLEWLDGEFSRIPKYMAKDDLCSFQELADYLQFLHS